MKLHEEKSEIIQERMDNTLTRIETIFEKRWERFDDCTFDQIINRIDESYKNVMDKLDQYNKNTKVLMITLTEVIVLGTTILLALFLWRG